VTVHNIVFAKAGMDNVTSAMCKHQQWFGLTIINLLLVVNFNYIFNRAFVPGLSFNEFPAFANTLTLAGIV